jgi:hypothetical protein
MDVTSPEIDVSLLEHGVGRQEASEVPDIMADETIKLVEDHPLRVTVTNTFLLFRRLHALGDPSQFQISHQPYCNVGNLTGFLPSPTPVSERETSI